MDAPSYCVWGVLYYPYFFENSFVFYTVNYGVFFFVIALLLMKKTTSSNYYRNSLFVGLSLSMATLCQQFYLVIPFAILSFRFFEMARGKKLGIASDRYKFVISSLLLLLPMAFPALLFFRWEGLTHPAFEQHELVFNIPVVVSIFFVVGFYFIFFLAQHLKRIRRVDVLLSLLISIILVLFFKPKFNDLQGEGYFTGIVVHTISLSKNLWLWLPHIIMTILSTAGVLTLITFLRLGVSSWDMLLFTMALALSVTYIVNSQIGERHLLGMMVLLLFLLMPRLKPTYAWLQVGYMITVTIFYFFYWNFFKFGT
jgi:hypothetical protein